MGKDVHTQIYIVNFRFRFQQNKVCVGVIVLKVTHNRVSPSLGFSHVVLREQNSTASTQLTYECVCPPALKEVLWGVVTAVSLHCLVSG